MEEAMNGMKAAQQAASEIELQATPAESGGQTDVRPDA